MRIWPARARPGVRGAGVRRAATVTRGLATRGLAWARTVLFGNVCVSVAFWSQHRGRQKAKSYFSTRYSCGGGAGGPPRHPSLQDTRGVRGPQHQLYMYGPAKNDIILRKSLRAPSLHWPRYRFLTFLKRSFAGGTITAARAGHSANHSVVVTQHQGRRRITSARVLSCASPAPSRFSREKTRSQWLAHTSINLESLFDCLLVVGCKPTTRCAAMGNSMKLLRTVPRDRRFPGKFPESYILTGSHISGPSSDSLGLQPPPRAGVRGTATPGMIE